MGLMKYFLGLAITSAAITNARADILYDDFSSGSLDTTKWLEDSYSDHLPFTTIHEVREINGNQHYYVFQEATNSSDPLAGGETNLTATREFQSGESLRFDLEFLSKETGSTWFSRFLVNDTTNGSLSPPTGTYIGWNHGQGRFGWDLGSYDVRVDFLEDRANFTVTDPSGNTLMDTIGSANHPWISSPYEFTINTQATSGASVEFAYDNFRITPVPEPSLLTLMLPSSYLILRKNRK